MFEFLGGLLILIHPANKYYLIIHTSKISPSVSFPAHFNMFFHNAVIHLIYGLCWTLSRQKQRRSLIYQPRCLSQSVQWQPERFNCVGQPLLCSWPEKSVPQQQTVETVSRTVYVNWIDGHASSLLISCCHSGVHGCLLKLQFSVLWLCTSFFLVNNDVTFCGNSRFARHEVIDIETPMDVACSLPMTQKTTQTYAN